MKFTRRQAGFTFIEVLVLIIVTSLVMSTLLFGVSTALRGAPSTEQQWVAVQTARQCQEWFLEQRRLQGYGNLSCPSSPTAAACAAPSGYSVSTAVSCTTWNGDTQYKTITVTVSGLASASLFSQIGDY